MVLLPTQREVYDAVGNPRKPGASSWSYDGGSSNERGGSSSGGSHMTSSPYDGDSSYERGASSLGGSNGTSSPGTGCTRGGVQDSPNSYSSHQSSCHGSEYDLEADLDSEISTERMRSIVSSILPDDGLDTPSDRWSTRSPSAQAFLRDQELRWQYQDRWESNGVFEPRGDQTFHAVRLRSNNGPARFPSTEMDGFPNEERNHHQIPKEQESDTSAAFLGIPTDTCVHANLSYLSGSQHNGSGLGNSIMMRELQQYTMNAQELYLKEMPKSVEITRACGVNGGNAADVNLLLENLGITDRNSAEQKNKPLVWHLSKMPYQQGWQTTNIEWAELKNIRETNGLNSQQIRSYPANEHVWPHETLETGFSSPLPPIIDTDNSVSSTLVKSCNGSAAGSHSVGSDFPFPGRRQENRGTASPKNPHVYNCNCDSPPQRQIVDNSQPKRFINRPTFLPRTPNGQTSVRSVTANNEYPLSRTPLPKQNFGSKYRAAHAGEDAWRTPGNLVQLQHSPATKVRQKQGRRRGRKAVFQKGQTSISVVLDPKTVAPRSHRQLNVSDANVLQLIPVEHPRTKLDVCTQGQYKTELCNKWQTKGCCPYGDQCMYAHGVQELRCVIRHPRYKSQLCHKFAAGLPCHYGHRCHYRHSLQSDPDELTVISTLSVRVMGATS